MLYSTFAFHFNMVNKELSCKYTSRGTTAKGKKIKTTREHKITTLNDQECDMCKNDFNAQPHFTTNVYRMQKQIVVKASHDIHIPPRAKQIVNLACNDTDTQPYDIAFTDRTTTQIEAVQDENGDEH